MTRFLLAGAMAFGMMSGIALAQSTTLQTTTTTAPVVLAPPTGTLSTSTSTKSIGPDGARTDTSGTTYRNSNGVASDTELKTTTYPPPPVALSTTNNTSTTTTTTR